MPKTIKQFGIGASAHFASFDTPGKMVKMYGNVLQ
jgi:hypothetical protein